MNFIKIDGLDLKAKSLMLLKKAKDNPDWLQNTLMWFVGEQQQRALTGEDLNLPSRITIRL